MKIRQAKLEDLDRIVEIELENFLVEEAIPRSVFEAHLRLTTIVLLHRLPIRMKIQQHRLLTK